MVVLRENASIIIGAILAVVLQIILAPSISLLYATPNFILVFCVMMGIRAHNAGALIAAFLLGLIYNLLGTSPVGVMAVCLLVITFILTMIFSVIEGAHPVVAIPTMLVSCLIVELLYVVALTLLGLQPNLFQACIFGAIPNAIYDGIVGLILYPLISHFFVSNTVTKPAASVSTIRLR